MKKRASWRHWLVYGIIRLRKSKEFYSQSGDAFWNAVMRKRPKRGSRPGIIHRAWFRALGWKFTEDAVAGFPVFTLKTRRAQRNTRKTRTILYLHGGGYVDEMTWFHWEFLWRILWRTGAQAVVIQYPLAPEYHCMDATAMIRETYRKLLETVPAEEIIVMGDSAGGGLTLTCAMDFRNEGLSQPRHLVMISPGLEVSGADLETDAEARALEACDPMLSFGSFNTILEGWRGELSEKDWRIHGLYGDCRNLAPMTLFVGTRDILYRGARRFRERVEAVKKEASVQLEYWEHPGMFHCWILVPFPESLEERKRIVEIVRQN